MSEPIENLRQIRLEKLEKIKKLGINPYPARCNRKQTISQALNLMGEKVAVAGRIMSIRGHGGIQFLDLRDESGKIQLLLKNNLLKTKDQQLLALLDIGDFINVQGGVTQTQAGEISILVDTFDLLTKSIRPLPSQWYGLKDIEERYRKRYLDFLMDPEKKKLFERKSKFWEVNRKFMQEKGFIEIETPIMEHVTGGADAKPFTTHHSALDEDFYLRISTELYQKRLIGAGFEKIFTLGPNFRNEGIDDEHLQEFYQIEWYWAYADYRQNMKMVEEMFNYIAKQVYGKTEFTKGNHTFDISKKWDEIDYHQIIKEKMNIDIFNSSEKEMINVLENHGVKLEGELNRARIIDDLWKIIRKEITGPAFLINEPKFTSPLAKSKTEDERFTERFHVIIAGTELGNGYSELNDPIDQLERFKEQQDNREKGDQEAQMLDLDFVEMLEYGMPPTSGYAHSERLFWFLENITAREGTLFPQMKNLIDPLTLKMYGLKSNNLPDSNRQSTNSNNNNIPDEHSKRFVAVLSKKVEIGKLVNALGHMTAGLVGGYTDPKGMYFLMYEDKDGGVHPNISHFPLIVLEADNSNKIRTLRNQAIEKNIPFTDFTSTMTIGTSKEQQNATKNSQEKNLEYIGICLFGTTEELKELTKKFSLFK